MSRLADVYNQTTYKITGHGPRTIGVLKKVLDGLDPDSLSDMYGQGSDIEGFETKMADLLGKEGAVFFPSGTMAQQVAMRIHCDRKGIQQVAYHPLCHMEIHEQEGLKHLHKIESVLVGSQERLFTLDDLKAIKMPVACLVHELPQREIGGQLPSMEALREMVAYTKSQGVVNHLDGARLFECLPYYQCDAKGIGDLFDTVYLSFYKGLGGIAGAILAGDAEFVKEAKIWKRRHGGDLISLYPYVLSADFYYEERRGKMAAYHKEATDLAAMFNSHQGMMTLPSVPVTNMFHVHFTAKAEKVEEALTRVGHETSIGLSSYARPKGQGGAYFEVSVGDRLAQVPKAALEIAIDRLEELLTSKKEED